MAVSSKPKSASIPSWQRREHSQDTEADAENGEPQEPASEALPRAALLEKASKFLEDSEIKNASMERKITYLEGKGLKMEEIHNLLGISKTGEDIITAPGDKVRGDGESRTTQSSLDPTAPSKTVREPVDLPPNDVPPIITYPEFLLHSQKPPSLITAPGLLTAAYVISGASALIYGTSKYIVKPMIESLSSARHELFGVAAANVNTLNEKLAEAASSVPDDHKLTPDSGEDTEDLEASAFFHRSAGTQTSPHLSRSSSASSDAPGADPSEIQRQSDWLEGLQQNLKDLLSPMYSEITGLEPGKQMKTKVDEFQRYLDGLANGNAENVPGFAGNKGKEDSIARVKADIRQTKGILLSSRNFPSSIGTKSWGTT